VVLLTGPGRAAVASLLVEGPRATEIVAGLFHPAGRRPLGQYACGRIVFGRWQSPDEGEEIVVCRRAADRIEIHCHGGQAAAAAIIGSLVAAGCREWNWRDWTRDQAPDPIAAEAAIALAGAPTERTAMILLDQQQGALGRALDDLAARLAAGDAPGALARIERLLGWSALGAHLVSPWKVVLAGRPNVGKSSLINALLGYQRAIVHATPGTTRDVVTATTAVDGWPIELADTAGLRASGDALEAAGIERARQMLRAADLVVFVFDATAADEPDQHELRSEWPAALRVLNKCDLAAPGDERPGLRTSALQGHGVDELARAIAARLVPAAPPTGEAVPFLPEHVQALVEARAALAGGDTAGAARLLGQLGR
jgi:tRNA modification GTPase